MYDNTNYRLILSDNIEFLNSLSEQSVDMIFADPPYFLSNGGVTCKNGKSVSVDKGSWDKSNGIHEDFNYQLSWIEAAKRVLKDNGTLWISGTYHSIYSCGFALQMLDFKLINEIAWYKPNAAPNLSRKTFTASHETLIWAAKNKDSKYTFNYKEMKEGDWHLKDILKNEDKQMRSVWSLSTTPKSEKEFGKHPTQKPLSLLERVVLSSTNVNDIILDPFNGSGTTGVAAIKHGRRYIGVDINADYLELTKKRLDTLEF